MSEAAISRLPELERVPWRPLADARRLDRLGLMWTGWTIAHTLPFIAVAVALMSLQPLALPVALVAIAHAWIIPELYAQRGANVVRPRSTAGPGKAARHPAEGIAAGLLGDLVGHAPRDL